MEPKIGQVFVAGGAPTITYVARDALDLEKGLSTYLEERYRILSLSGPTKSGKTVLLSRVVPNTIGCRGARRVRCDILGGRRDELGVYTGRRRRAHAEGHGQEDE